MTVIVPFICEYMMRAYCNHMIRFLVLLFGIGLAGEPSASLYAVAAASGAQDPDSLDRLITVRASIVQGDTIPVIDLKPFNLVAPRYFSSRYEAMRYQRLVRNVKLVYPYARLAGNKLIEYEEELRGMTDAERRRATRRIEREIRDEFETDLMSLTRSQGTILIKLIDRETRHTSYDLLRDLRGMVSAVFWQSLGRIFGYNLKTGYDPYGEDFLIEEIVQLIEAGFL